MAHKKENLLLFGATGYIGTYILAAILEAKSSFGRIALFTSPDTVARKSEHIRSLKDQGVEVIVGDATKSSDIISAFEGIDTVISAVGRNVLAQQINWIKLAEESASVKRFFPSEFGTDIEYSASSAHEIPHQQKLKVRAVLKTVKDLEYTYVVTGPYADAQKSAFFGPLPVAPELGSYDLKHRKAFLVGDGKGKISFTTPRDVGKLVVQALLHPEASRNRALRVNSFTTTPEEILAEFEAQYGGEKWSVTYTPLERLRELEREAWAKESPLAAFFTLTRIWNEGGTLYEKRDNGLIDAEDTETLADTVRRSIAIQTADHSFEDYCRKYRVEALSMMIDSPDDEAY